MKIFFLAIFFTAFNIITAYCAGAAELVLSNVQEINLEHIDNIDIRYSSENIILFKNSSDTLIIKEYFNRDNSGLHAKITASANELIVSAGDRFRNLTGINFKARIEIYIPDSNKNFSIVTSSGRIEGKDRHAAASFNIASSSGSININSITADNIGFITASGGIRGETIIGNAELRTSSGNIVFGSASGEVNAASSSGRIEINRISGSLTANSSSGGMKFGITNGSINATTSSGGINCTVIENTDGISITTSSADVFIELPQTISFNFFSRTTSGRLRTPFSDRLSVPLNDRNSVQGIIGENTSGNQERVNININTTSGSINVTWRN